MEVWKKALESLAEMKEWKQVGEEVKLIKKSRATGKQTLAYLREKATKDHNASENLKWGRESPKIVTWAISSPAGTATANSATNVTTLAESTAGNDGLIWKKNPKNTKYGLSTINISNFKISWLRVNSSYSTPVCK